MVCGKIQNNWEALWQKNKTKKKTITDIPIRTRFDFSVDAWVKRTTVGNLFCNFYQGFLKKKKKIRSAGIEGTKYIYKIQLYVTSRYTILVSH